MRSLGPSIANPIQRCIEQLTTSENFDDITVQKADDSRAGSSQRSLPIDSPSSTLLLEEQLIQARSATFNLQKHNDLLSAELEQAREQIKQLQQTITSDQSTTTRQADDVDTILANIRTEHADNIALLEEELYNAQTKITAQAKQLTQITALETSNAVLRTELDRLRHERDDLEQKHNATENLKKKLKSLQDEQTTSDLLRQNHEVAQAELDELRPLRDHNVQLKRKLQEVTQHLHSLEQTSHDDQRALEHAETELSYLNQSLIESREQHQRDQERLSEYQGRLRELELTQEDASFAASLEQELSTLESPLQSPTESSVVSPTRTVSGTQRGGGDDESGDSEVIVSQQILNPPHSPRTLTHITNLDTNPTHPSRNSRSLSSRRSGAQQQQQRQPATTQRRTRQNALRMVRPHSPSSERCRGHAETKRGAEELVGEDEKGCCR